MTLKKSSSLIDIDNLLDVTKEEGPIGPPLDITNIRYVVISMSYGIPMSQACFTDTEMIQTVKHFLSTGSPIVRVMTGDSEIYFSTLYEFDEFIKDCKIE